MCFGDRASLKVTDVKVTQEGWTPPVTCCLHLAENAPSLLKVARMAATQVMCSVYRGFSDLQFGEGRAQDAQCLRGADVRERRRTDT